MAFNEFFVTVFTEASLDHFVRSQVNMAHVRRLFLVVRVKLLELVVDEASGLQLSDAHTERLEHELSFAHLVGKMRFLPLPGWVRLVHVVGNSVGNLR